MGKGDKQRPVQDRDRFNRNWERIFGGRHPPVDSDINPAEWDQKEEKSDG